jgi:hypothetical protein
VTEDERDLIAQVRIVIDYQDRRHRCSTM